MNAAELISLAERVEALTGPCRETDARIAVAVLGWSIYRSKHNYFVVGSPDGAQYVTGHFPDWAFDPVTGKRYEQPVEYWGWADDVGDVDPFTASFDAAMSLVPQGYEWRYSTLEGDAVVWHYERAGVFRANALSAAARALTAAALRARAAMEE